MGKGKPRHNPKKLQNRYGSKCSYYEVVMGESYCERLLTNGNPTKICKGNRHNCCKVKFHDMAQKKVNNITITGNIKKKRIKCNE